MLKLRIPTVSKKRPSAVMAGSQHECTGSQKRPNRVLKRQPSPPGPQVA